MLSTSRFRLSPQHFAVSLGSLAMLLMLQAPLGAQIPTLQDLQAKIPQSRIDFSPYTVGTVIYGATDRLYVLRLQKGDRFLVQIHNMGFRSRVTLFDGKGDRLRTFSGQTVNSGAADNRFEYVVPETGDYYVLAYGGPTYHVYDFTLRVQP